MKASTQATLFTVVGFALFGVALFWPAGTFDYWQAWVFLAVFLALGTVYTVYLVLKHPDVLRRRMNAGPAAETRPVQKFVSAAIYVTFAALLVVSALDYRFGWSSVPTAVVLAGDVLVAVGLVLSMIVVVQNNYAAANITVEAEQQVVSTGLYGIVRHPMYFSAMILLVGVPLALGSYWGLVLIVPSLAVFAIRILDEEQMLRDELAGYREYTDEVRSRLVPHVW